MLQYPTPVVSSKIHEKNRNNSTNGVLTTAEKDHISENGHQNNDGDLWDHEEITLERGPSGLGFTIAGGIDNPHYKNDSKIYITRIIPNSPASSDGRLKLEDIIVKVEETDLLDIKHAEAVAALKNSGKRVQLLVKRRRKPVDSSGNSADIVDSSSTNTQSKLLQTKSQDTSPRLFTSALKSKSEQLPVTHQDVAQNITPLTKITTDNLSTHDTSLNNKAPKLGTIASTQNVYDSDNNNKVYDLFGKNASISKSTPAIAHPISCITKAQRKVILHRSSKGLGFNIVGDIDGGGIFISYLVPDGTASKSNKLHCGDQIISVNGIDLRSATHEQAANTLKQAGQTVKLTVKYRPDGYMKFESRLGMLRENSMTSPGSLKTSTKLSLYARALFDYDPSKDSGLPSRGLMFKFGDILHITNASDDEWWQARKVLDGGQEDTVHGIIPSKKRVEKRERTRMKSVKFIHRISSESTLDRRHKRFSFTKKFPYMKSRENIDEEFDLSGSGSRGILSLSSTTSFNSGERGSLRNLEESIPSYEPVILHDINYSRPLALFGAVKEEIESLRDDLSCDGRFFKMETIAPHTTRPPKQGEVDGAKYHFVSLQEMKKIIANHQFIEVGELNGHLYGTTVDSIRESAQSGKHCLLNISPKAIKKLHDADIYPIVILIKPKSIESLLEMNKRWSYDEAMAAMDCANRLEQEYNSYITTTIQKDNLSEIFREVLNIVSQQSGTRIWIPTTFEALNVTG